MVILKAHCKCRYNILICSILYLCFLVNCDGGSGGGGGGIDIEPVMPAEGTSFQEWGWDGSYQVWVNNLQLEETEDCIEWKCPLEVPLYLPYDNTWVFIGEGTGTETFDFPGEYTDIVITFDYDRWAFDSIIGHTDSGDSMGVGYTIDGEYSYTFFETWHFSNQTISDYQHNGEPLPEPCGFAGTEPDENYSITYSKGGVIFRMMDTPYDELMKDRSKWHSCYSLTSITIYAKPYDELLDSDEICP